jgi:WD40 repeat protein
MTNGGTSQYASMKSFRSLSEERAYLLEVISDHLLPVIAQVTIEYLPIREIPVRELLLERSCLKIALSSDRIYTKIFASPGCKIYDLEGRPSQSWDLSSQEYSYLGKIFDISACPQGEVFIIDTLSHFIKVLSPSGKILRQWKVKTYLENGEEHPRSCPFSLAVMNNKLYVIDLGYKGILVYSLQGELLQKREISWLPHAMSRIIVSPDEKRLYAIDDSNLVTAYDLEDSKICWQFKDEKPLFTNSNRIALSPQGEIYLTDNRNGRIRILNQAGQFIREWSYESMKRMTEINTIIFLPRGGDSEIYITDHFDSKIYVFRQSYFQALF